MGEWTIGAVLDAIAESVPDRLMTVCGDRRSTFAETAERTRRLANFFAGRGFGAHRERDSLDRWECGQDRVALIMHNDLYADIQATCGDLPPVARYEGGCAAPDELQVSVI
jgi:acyl-CoA synthetase (AMP-forming)/AMP-acid ligase II